MSAWLDPFERMLDAACPPDEVRAIEDGGDPQPVWAAFAQSGFGDALVDGDSGGAGLTFAEVVPLIVALGARAMPLPLAETLVARALLARAGIAAPDGAIALATSLALPVPGARAAGHALVDCGDRLVLAALDPQPTGVYGSLAARLDGAPQGPALVRPDAGLRAVAAVVRAAQIAGAIERLATLAVRHAGERVQFGKPIGRQQALQQMLAVMAEDLVAARVAASLGAARGLDVPLALAATAKITASAAAARAAQSAHAVFGAIGIARDHDAQLYTRRLHEWRLADGSESHWAQRLGAMRLADPRDSVDWVRDAVFAAGSA